MSIDPDGRVTGYRWLKGSGNARWDDSVKHALAQTKAISRPPPKGFPGKFLVRFDVESDSRRKPIHAVEQPVKKISKGHHSSLNELNITPLLDLAFVLLVIFIITTPQLSNDLEMNLPSPEEQHASPRRRPRSTTSSWMTPGTSP